MGGPNVIVGVHEIHTEEHINLVARALQCAHKASQDRDAAPLPGATQAARPLGYRAVACPCREPAVDPAHSRARTGRSVANTALPHTCVRVADSIARPGRAPT